MFEKEFKEINNPEIEARFKRAVSMVKIKPNKKETLGNYMRRIARLDTTIEGHDYWANLGICIEYSPNELNNEKYKHFLLNKLSQSLFIHFLNNLVVCIFRYYLHNNYFESPMARLLDEELRKLKDKKLVTNPITNWFPQEDNITTPKSKSE